MTPEVGRSRRRGRQLVLALSLAVGAGLVAWPDTRAEGIPSHTQARLLASCRDALEAHLELDLRPEVGRLPRVESRGDGRYRLIADAAWEGGSDLFACDVEQEDGHVHVREIHVLSW